MALADRFYRNGYEQEFEVDLIGLDGEPSGLKVWVKDMTCDAAVAVTDTYKRKSTDLMLRHARTGDDGLSVDVPEGARGELYQDEVRDKYVACISRWDFNGEGLFSDDDPNPECSHENKCKFLTIPGISEQVVGKIDGISGFTKPLKKG